MKKVKMLMAAVIALFVFSAMVGCGCGTTDNGETSDTSTTESSTGETTTPAPTTNPTSGTDNNNSVTGEQGTDANGGVIDDIGNGIGEGVQDIGNGIGEGIQDMGNGLNGTTGGATR